VTVGNCQILAQKKKKGYMVEVALEYMTGVVSGRCALHTQLELRVWKGSENGFSSCTALTYYYHLQVFQMQFPSSGFRD